MTIKGGGVLTLNLKKLVGDPVIWQRLHDEHVGLLHAWHDRTNGRYYAYAITPWLPDLDDSMFWDPEYDDRARLMQSGGTIEEAVLALFDDPRRKVQPSIGRCIAALSAEIVKLTGVIGSDRH